VRVLAFWHQFKKNQTLKKTIFQDDSFTPEPETFSSFMVCGLLAELLTIEKSEIFQAILFISLDII
jgi:hypothetical protein